MGNIGRWWKIVESSGDMEECALGGAGKIDGKNEADEAERERDS